MIMKISWKRLGGIPVLKNQFWKNILWKACCFLLIAATVLTCLPMPKVSAAPAAENKTAKLAWTLKGLQSSNVVQNFHIADEYIYITQATNSNETYISRLKRNDSAKTATFDKGMKLTNAGIGESLDMFNHKGKVYFWVGLKDLTTYYYSSQMGRVEFQAGATLGYTSVTRFSGLDYATSDGSDGGTLYRVAAATCGQYSVFRVALNDGEKVLYTIYNNTALNNFLDSSSAKNPAIVGAKSAIVASFTQTEGASNYVAPNNSFQGIEISGKNSIYLSGGNGTKERPQIAMMNSNGTYKKLLQFTNWGTTNNPTIQGMQAKQGNIYFLIPEGSDRTNGQKIYYIEETAFGVTHTQYLTRAGTRTCESAGISSMAYYCEHCDCDQDVADYAPALGHNYVDVAAVAATCTAYGKTAGKVCSRCNKWSVLQTDIAPTGHSYNAGVVTREPTCALVGIRTFTCSKCSGSYTKEIEKLLHKDGNNDTICDVCNCSTDAEPQNILLDYAKTIESNIIEKAIINGIPAEHLRDAKLVSVTAADDADNSLYSSDILDNNGDGLAETLSFSLKKILQKVLRLNCKISFTGPDGASYERMIPVNIVPATSVYYETDAAKVYYESEATNEMFKMTTTGSAWKVEGSLSNEKQDSGDTNEPVSELAYNFQNIPSGAFFTDFNGGETRYARDYVYAGVNYDAESNWGYDGIRLSGRTVDNVLGTMTLTRKQGDYTHFWLQSGGDTQANYNLNYIPKDNHYALIRLKFTSAAFTDSVSPKVMLLYYTASDKTEGGTSTDHTELAGEADIPAEYLTNGKYVTIKFKLNFNESYLRERVTAFRWGIYGLQNGQRSASDSVTIDYIYVGPLEGIKGVEGFENCEDSAPNIAPEYYEAPTYGYNDYLLFDFDNSPEARVRYNNTAYKNQVDYDKASYWTALYDNYSSDGYLQNRKREGKAVTVDNQKGTLTIPVAVQQSNSDGEGRYGSYFGPTNGKNQLISFTDVGTDATIYPCLNFTPKSNTTYYFHIRLKVSGCKKDDVLRPDSTLSVQFSCMAANSSNWLFNNSPTYKLDYDSNGNLVEKYITLSDNVTEQVSKCSTIVSLYFRLNNLMRIGSSNGKVEIDYIYLGPEKDPTKIRSPKQENVMIDFDNGDYDKNRYAGQLYGGVNCDSTGGWGNVYWFTPTFANSVMKLTPTQVALTQATGAGRISPQGDNAYLDYKMTGADYIVVRMKTNNISARADSTKGATFTLYFGEKDKVNYGEGAIGETYVDVSGQWKDYIYDISSYAQKFDTIRYLFIEFNHLSYGTNPSIEIDFFYIGTRENGTLPADALYFGFGNRLEDQTRYNSRTYGNRNFDDAAKVAQNYYCSTASDALQTSIAINDKTGTLELSAEAGNGNCAWFDTVAGKYASWPLNYHPGNAEIIQIRFKMENFMLSTGKTAPFFKIQYFNGLNDVKHDVTAVNFPASYLTNGEYITLTIDLSDSLGKTFCNQGEISKLRIFFGDILCMSGKTGKIIIDYLYIGPGEGIEMPEMTYGYDASYSGSGLYSGGSSYFVDGAGIPTFNSDYTPKYNGASYTEASFTFTGTGFDIISRTGVNQGLIRAMIYDSTGKHVKSVQVLNKSETNKEFYQIPVMSVEMKDDDGNLVHGTYDVKLFVAAAYDFDDSVLNMNGMLDRGGEFYFDAVRIHNTIGATSSAEDGKLANDLYQQHKEAEAETWEIRQLLLEADSFNAESGVVDGIIYLNNQNGAVSMDTYREVGPNNEVYLSNGHAIAFKLEASGVIPASVDIGAKVIENQATTMLIAAGNKPTAASAAGQSINIASGTVQNYAVKLNESDWVMENGKYCTYITVSNNGTGLMSLTNVKCAYDYAGVTATGTKSIRFLAGNELLLPPVEEGTVEDTAITIGEQLSLKSDLTMNFRIKESQLTAYDLSSAYLVVERDIYSTDGTMAVDTQTITEFSQRDGRLIFVYSGIAASQMNDEIRVTMFIKDAEGREYKSLEKVTSVTTYAKLLLETMPTGYDKLYTVVMDMLNYGTAAQSYFNRHADAPANEAYAIFADYAAYATGEEVVLEDLSKQTSNDGATAVISQTLELGTRIGIQYKVALPGDVDAANAVLVIRDAEGEKLESINLSTGAVDNRGRYVVNFYGLASRQMRDAVTATLYVDGVAISDSYTYSISSYAYAVANTNGMPENLMKLTKLMVAYGDSAAAYFG